MATNKVTMTPSSSSSPSAYPTVSLDVARDINDINGEAIMPRPEPLTSYSFDPTPTQTTPDMTATSESAMRTVSPSTTATLWQEPSQGTEWYRQGWVGPATWMLLIYCAVSATLFTILAISGSLDRRLNLRTPPFRTRSTHDSTNVGEMHAPYRQRNRDSIETELGDQGEEAALEHLRREWMLRGVHFTPEQMLAQQRAYEMSQREAARRDRMRARQNAVVEANLRAYGYIP